MVFGSSRQFAFPGDAQSDIFVFADTIVWSAAPWQTNVPPLRPGAGSIHELTIATGEARILYTASNVKAAVTVKASADWLTWLETTDTFGLRDARLLAMPRGGGTPVVIDDMRRYPARASFPMWCIDGADVYWTVPELRGGKPTADLHHKRLPDGPTEVLVAAQPGQVIALPSAQRGVVAYEVRSDRADARVMIRLASGATREVGVAPASEPTVGDGFVAFKRANVAQTGTLAAVFLSDDRIVNLGVGEQPRAAGAWLAWGSWVPDPQDSKSPSPVFVGDPRLGCIARFQRPLPNANSSLSIPAIGGGRAVWVLSDFDKPQAERQSLIVEELRELRC